MITNIFINYYSLLKSVKVTICDTHIARDCWAPEKEPGILEPGIYCQLARLLDWIADCLLLDTF